MYSNFTVGQRISCPKSIFSRFRNRLESILSSLVIAAATVQISCWRCHLLTELLPGILSWTLPLMVHRPMVTLALALFFAIRRYFGFLSVLFYKNRLFLSIRPLSLSASKSISFAKRRLQIGLPPIEIDFLWSRLKSIGENRHPRLTHR